MAITYTQATVDALQAALAAGVRRVRFQSGNEIHEVEYPDMDAIRATLATAQQALNAAAGVSNYTLAGTRKGF